MVPGRERRTSEASNKEMARLIVKYIGDDDIYLTPGKEYEVLSVEHGWYRIMTREGDYLFHPSEVEIVEGEPQKDLYDQPGT